MVQKKIQKDHPPKRKGADYYLSGKLFCGNCEKAYKGVSGTSKNGVKHLYYKCSCDVPNIPARKFEQFVADGIASTLLDPETLDYLTEKTYQAYLDQYRAETPPSEDPKKKLAKVERSIDALLINLEKRPGSDSLLEKLDALEAERDALRADVAQSKKMETGPHWSREAFRSGLEAFLEGFDFDDSETSSRRILDAFVRKIVKKDEKILVELNFTELEPLELEDLVVFDQTSDWWSSSKNGRTLICGTAAVLVLNYTA